LGLYYTTLEREGMRRRPWCFGSVEEVEHATDADVQSSATPQSKRRARFSSANPPTHSRDEAFRHHTRPYSSGALVAAERPKAPFDWSKPSVAYTQKVQQVIDTALSYSCVRKNPLSSVTRSMDHGFPRSLSAPGILLSVERDMLSPRKTKWTLVDRDSVRSKILKQQYWTALIIRRNYAPLTHTIKLSMAGPKCNGTQIALSRTTMTGAFRPNVAMLRVQLHGANSVYIAPDLDLAPWFGSQHETAGAACASDAKPNWRHHREPII